MKVAFQTYRPYRAVQKTNQNSNVAFTANVKSLTNPVLDEMRVLLTKDGLQGQIAALKQFALMSRSPGLVTREFMTDVNSLIGEFNKGLNPERLLKQLFTDKSRNAEKLTAEELTTVRTIHQTVCRFIPFQPPINKKAFVVDTLQYIRHNLKSVPEYTKNEPETFPYALTQLAGNLTQLQKALGVSDNGSKSFENWATRTGII